MNPYKNYVESVARLLREGEKYPLGGFEKPAKIELPEDAPKVLIFSPHPDDEVIIGAAALRMMREAGCRVMNVAVTLGSSKARQAARWAELTDCCDYISFDLISTGESGLENINERSRKENPESWSLSVKKILEILLEHRPHTILFPHIDDNNSTHVGVHLLLMDALALTPDDFSCHILETEFWGAMVTPNVMVESSVEELTDLITALTFHVEEVKRNPYHLRTPDWMIDNVRRGGELVGAQGGKAPDFTFATLYRYLRWKGGKIHSPLKQGRFIGSQDNIQSLFED